MVEYELITTISVNLGRWAKTDEGKRGKLPDGWRRFMFQEAAFNLAWLPPDCYGKLCVEIKTRHWSFEGMKSGVALGWQKAVRDGGRGQMRVVEGSEIWMDKFEKWEMHESDFFPLPKWDEPILLWMLGYGEMLEEETAHTKISAPGIAMWTVGFFRKIE